MPDVSEAIADGVSVTLSDRDSTADLAPIRSLLLPARSTNMGPGADAHASGDIIETGRRSRDHHIAT